MTEQKLVLGDPNVVTLWVITDTIPAYRQLMKSLGATTKYASQEVYTLGRFSIHWLDTSKLEVTLGPQSPDNSVVVLGPWWEEVVDIDTVGDFPNGDFVKICGLRYVYVKELRNYEGVGL